jgi:flagellar motor protein MotB
MMMISRSVLTFAASAAVVVLAACAPVAPPPPPSPPNPPIMGPTSISERSLLTVAADLAFREGGYTLTPAGKAKLDEIVPALQALNNAKVVIYGYTDSKPVGSALKKRGLADNLDLSSKRANEVVRYLESKGVNPDILSSKGRGDTHPVAPNDTREGRAQNRRIEVVVEQPTG